MIKSPGEVMRIMQFQRDFFEQHPNRGNSKNVVEFCKNYEREFEAYFAKRIEAAIARKAVSRVERLERKCGLRTAAAAAKALRLEQKLSRAASAAAAVAAKVSKAPCVVLPAYRGFPRSFAAHEALKQERRIRKRAKRVATVALKQARRLAAILSSRSIEEGIYRVRSRVVCALDDRESLQFVPDYAFSPVHPCRVGRVSSLKSKAMPRRKHSARKIGTYFHVCSWIRAAYSDNSYTYSTAEWERLANAGGTIPTAVSGE